MPRPRPLNFVRPSKFQDLRSTVQRTPDASWYRIENSANGVEIYLYDAIGWWGVTANDFVDSVKSVGSMPISLHINSGGGDVWDGVAIYEAIRAHPAEVTVHIDGIAASAASLIAMAGDRVVIGKAATVMIHDASWDVYGNAEDHLDAAQILEKVSATIAEVYADRAGGQAADWRAAMQAGTDGTWYTAAEAVEIGLADEIAEPPAKALAAAVERPAITQALPKSPALAPAVVNAIPAESEPEPTWRVLAAAYVSALKEAQ